MSEDQGKAMSDDELDKFLDGVLKEMQAGNTPAMRNVTQMVIRPLTPDEFTVLYACVEVAHRCVHGDGTGMHRAFDVLDRRGHGNVCKMAHLFQDMAMTAMQANRG